MTGSFRTSSVFAALLRASSMALAADLMSACHCLSPRDMADSSLIHVLAAHGRTSYPLGQLLLEFFEAWGIHDIRASLHQLENAPHAGLEFVMETFRSAICLRKCEMSGLTSQGE
jgi:hypothetical protein